MAEQLHDIVVGWSVEQAGRGSDLQETTLLQHRNTVTELQGYIDIVGHHVQGFIEVLFQTQKLTLEFVTGNGIERAEGFVEEDDPGISRKGARKSHALSLPTGQFNGVPRLKLLRFELNKVQEFMHPACSSFGFPSE